MIRDEREHAILRFAWQSFARMGQRLPVSIVRRLASFEDGCAYQDIPFDELATYSSDNGDVHLCAIIDLHSGWDAMRDRWVHETGEFVADQTACAVLRLRGLAGPAMTHVDITEMHGLATSQATQSHLREFVTNCPNLEFLSVAERFDGLVACLPPHPRLSALYMHAVTADGIPDPDAIAQKFPCIWKLSIGTADVDPAIRKVSKLIGSIAHIDLRVHRLTRSGIEILASAFAESRAVRWVNVHANRVDDDARQAAIVHAAERAHTFGAGFYVVTPSPNWNDARIINAESRGRNNHQVMALYSAGLARLGAGSPAVAKFVARDGDTAIGHRVTQFLVDGEEDEEDV